MNGDHIHLYDRRDFPTACAKYAALVEEERRSGFPISAHGLSRHDQPDALTETEIAVFGINPALAGALFWAYCRYESLVGTDDYYFGEFAEAERAAFPEFYKGGVEDMEAAVAFMIATTCLPTAQCLGWVLKVNAAHVRDGLYTDGLFTNGHYTCRYPPPPDDDIPF